MDVSIKNLAELKLEIARLQGVRSEQEAKIVKHFSSPRAILGTITSLFKGKGTNQPGGFTLPGKDITAWISKFLLPLTLNKTLFKKSNFVVKALVGLISHKAAGAVNDKAVGSLWDKVKGILPNALVEKISPKKRKTLLRLNR